MDSLPNEMILEILKFLPPEDWHRMRRVNRLCRDLIDASKSKFTKPLIELKLTRPPSELQDGLLVIKAGHIRVQVIFEPDNSVNLLIQGRFSTPFIEAFYSSSSDMTSKPQNVLFLQWLLKKFDLKNLKIDLFPKWKELLEMVAAVISETETKCQHVFVRDRCESRPCRCGRPTTDLLLQLGIEQKNRGGATISVVSPELGDTISLPFVIDDMNDYSKAYSVVLLTLNHRMIHKAMFFLCFWWVNGKDVAINFHMGFDYTDVASNILTATHLDAARNCIRLHLSVNPSYEEFKGIAELHQVPPRIKFRNNATMQILTFHLLKVDTKVYLTVEKGPIPIQRV